MQTAGHGSPYTADFRLFEIGCSALSAFIDAHIPGASYIDTLSFEQPPLWNKVSDAALETLLLRHGVRHDTTVILYGRNQLAAARAAHLMLYAGVADVRLLDGGFHAWLAQNFPLASGEPVDTAAVENFGAAVPSRPHYLVNVHEARRMHENDATTLVSVRTWKEFIGQTSGYSYIAARGDIPGALWGRLLNDDDINGMSEFHAADGTMLPPERIAQIWQAGRIDSTRQAVFYCGTGWRASLAFFYAWLMGWEKISVFDGGWYEWSSNPANPVVCRALVDQV